MPKHVLPESSLRSHIAVLGKTGSGKSHTAKGIVEGLIKAGVRVCVIDPGGDWWGLRAAADGKRAGLAVAVLGGEHGDVAIAPTSGKEVAAFVAKEPIPTVVDLSDWYKTDQIRFMTAFSEEVYKLNRAPLHLVVDEADQYSPQQPMGEGKKLLNRMEHIVRLGRKRGFRVMMITQRPAILHKNVLTQCNTLIAMRMTAPQDRKAIDAWIEGNASAEEAKQVLSSLARLDVGEGWVWAPEADLLSRVQFPSIKTFDAGSTPEDGARIEPKKLADIDLAGLEKSFAPPEPPPKKEAKAASQDPQLRKKIAELEKAIAEWKQTIAAKQQAITALRDNFTEALQGMQKFSEALNGLDLTPSNTWRGPTPPKHLRRSKKAPSGSKNVQSFHNSADSAHTPGPDAHKPAKTIHISALGAGANRLLEVARDIYPVVTGWSTLCALASRKARGGAFNTARKQLLESGVVQEQAGTVVPTDPPTDRAADNICDVLEQALPTTPARMFQAIRENNGIFTKETLAGFLERAPHGGAWNTAMKMLRDCDAIVEDAGYFSINPDWL